VTITKKTQQGLGNVIRAARILIGKSPKVQRSKVGNSFKVKSVPEKREGNGGDKGGLDGSLTKGGGEHLIWPLKNGKGRKTPTLCRGDSRHIQNPKSWQKERNVWGTPVASGKELGSRDWAGTIRFGKGADGGQGLALAVTG